MTRAEMTAVFLATLDEIDRRGFADCDTIAVLLEGIQRRTAYPAIRAMFAMLLERAPMSDVERMFAIVSNELADVALDEAEQLAEEAQHRADEIEERKTSIVEALAGHPKLFDEWIANGERILAARAVH